MPAVQTSTFEQVLRYASIIIQIFVFPLGLLTLLHLARSDFHRWVNFKIREEGQDEELRQETEEFTE